ncbi:MAG TPA: hypothetical protein VK671_13960 [Mucilaginibacter sp.]|jgi:hypothetical protein|nr:hypothetical protein [Mucilaginibacter sp.]
MVKFSTRFFYLLMLISVVIAGCQKDESVKKTATGTTDSTKVSTISTPGNYLAGKGTLSVKLKDSTYTFNAEQDSIAFVNISIDGEEYYGLTAINKAHTVSFGISSSGMPIDDFASYVSGAQLLLKGTGKTNLEYTLIPGSLQQKFGTISIEKYNQDATLAKGTFHTFLATGTKYNSPNYEVTGTFELKIK